MFISPLSERMRPRVIADFIGQEHILGKGKVLREAIEKDAIPSFIIWGPPGCGKTTLSRIIKSGTKAHYVALAAVTSGVADVRQIVKEADVRKQRLLQKTILFVDEIHRFNKAQQDAFLPHVEKGTITLIGATTENPFFEVNSPLLSRARVYRLEPLSSENLRKIFERALADSEKGLGSYNASLTEEAFSFLIEACGGDARIALDAMETAVVTSKPGEDGKITVSAETLLDSMQSGKSLYDKKGEQHYDTISAFIKSVRGSNPDAAVYWMAKMLYNGEDPRFVARRLIILAAEDIGLADPFALNVANAAAQAVEFIGMPEAKIPLSEAAIYLSCAPKSNSAYNAINSAWAEAAKGEHHPVPFHLRNPVTKGMKAMGYGKGYKYPHDYPGHFVEANYLPDALSGKRFYEPGVLGHELKMKERLKKWWNQEKDQGSRE
jgi:putative ATPase